MGGWGGREVAHAGQVEHGRIAAGFQYGAVESVALGWRDAGKPPVPNSRSMDDLRRIRYLKARRHARRHPPLNIRTSDVRRTGPTELQLSGALRGAEAGSRSTAVRFACQLLNAASVGDLLRL